MTRWLVMAGIAVAALSVGPGSAADSPAAVGSPHAGAAVSWIREYVGTLTGGEKVRTTHDDHATPFGISFVADESYQGRADFTIRVYPGNVVTVSGSGDYTEASVKLTGTEGGDPNHKDGHGNSSPLPPISIDCPPVPFTTTKFKVGGERVDEDLLLDVRLDLIGASEDNPQVDCMPGQPPPGAPPPDGGNSWYSHFYIYAETTTNLADSLRNVMPFALGKGLAQHLHHEDTQTTATDEVKLTDDWDVDMIEIWPPGKPPKHEPPAGGPRANGCTITGTNKNDTLVGTPKADVICGLGGNDVIKGLGGNDIIVGGAGNDTIDGGSGTDSIFGGLGNDKLTGGAGNDSLFGDAGKDRLLAKDGAHDYVDGGSGKDSASVDRKDKLHSVETVARR